jgi:signal transduction histidine kinase
MDEHPHEPHGPCHERHHRARPGPPPWGPPPRPPFGPPPFDDRPDWPPDVPPESPEWREWRRLFRREWRRLFRREWQRLFQREARDHWRHAPHHRRWRHPPFLFGFWLLVLALIVIVGVGIALIPRPLIAFLVGLFFGIALLAGAALLSRRVFRPLRRVMEAAERIAEGDLSARVRLLHPGDLGRLAATFNHMADELERSDERRRRLTVDVAHELRTPLTVLQGNLEGMLEGVYQPTPEALRGLLDETRLLTRLVDDLRTLALAEAGQLHFDLQRLDVAGLLADARTSFGGQADGLGVRLEVDAPDALPPVRGDAQRLAQVLGNLISNALRHTPPGGQVTLSARAADGGVIVRVADTGPGIPPQDRPYVFDRFWKGDPARTRDGKGGAGLGLAIARQLVESHGGRIWVEDDDAPGATLAFSLPADEA